LGILLAIAGYGYVGFSVAQLLSPAFAARVLFPWVFPVAFLAESALCLWLLVKGVNISKWTERTQR
jgi:nitrate/nitrite transporter NarK